MMRSDKVRCTSLSIFHSEAAVVAEFALAIFFLSAYQQDNDKWLGRQMAVTKEELTVTGQDVASPVNMLTRQLLGYFATHHFLGEAHVS